MKLMNSNVCHIRYTENEECIMRLMYDIIDETCDLMHEYDCNLMYNTQTGERITFDEFYRLKGILSGLSEMDEIVKE